MPENGPSLLPLGWLIPAATENAPAARNQAVSGSRRVLPGTLSGHAEGAAHPRSWGSNLRRLTRWGPNTDGLPDRGTRHSQVRISPTESGFVDNGLTDNGLVRKELVENGSVENGSAEDGPGPTDSGQASVDAAAAMAAAVRRQLTFPGSVPPEEQLSLMLADRRAHQAVTKL